MDIRIRAMYFTGTGTTEKVAVGLADCIYKTLVVDLPEDKVGRVDDINFSPLEARKEKYSFDKSDFLVFGVPVIAGRVPNVLLKFLDTIEGGGAIAVPIVLYGNRNFDDALIELRNILEKCGFHTIAGAAFIGEHSFSRKLAAGRPDEKDMGILGGFAKDISEKIKKLIDEAKGDEQAFYDMISQMGPIEVDGCEPIRTYYKPRDRHGEHINILKVVPKVDEARCSGCGLCARVCPMGSIKKESPGVVDGICIKCCGCEKACPEGALYFDDPGYIYHKEELEEMYAARKEPKLFV